MRTHKAPGLLKKAVTMFKSKTDTLRTKLFILASLRRKIATVRAISRRIHALVSSDRENLQARLECRDKVALILQNVEADIQKEPITDTDHEHDGVIDLSEVALFVEDDHDHYPDWTHSLFNDEYYKNDDVVDDDDDDEDDDEQVHHDDHGSLDALNEPSVIDIIRTKREVEGLEFNMDDEIDQACDMFIKRFRKRMNRSF